MNELITYIIFNKDLDITKGKAMTQCARACFILANKERDRENTNKSFEELYENEKMYGNKTIILGAKEKDLNKFFDGKFKDALDDLNKSENKNIVSAYPVYDAGHNELDPNTLTCIILSPHPKEKLINVVKGIQVYKK